MPKLGLMFCGVAQSAAMTSLCHARGLLESVYRGSLSQNIRKVHFAITRTAQA
jgi:hypothetical protein